jgi:threonine/homoserine/homoserine lactone efflux protein
MIVTGAVITASNPYFIFWWAVVGLGLIMSSYNALGILGVALFYIGHILSDITWYSFISVVVSKSRAFINQKVYRITIAILGVFLIGFGVSFLLNSIGYIVGHI